ncbi:glyoxalase/bleomycin resistance/extradiol dioxygenase family protein [Pseudohalocynthiibacter aestuariivivens]|nr:VOC family protein [Pseudohalocynthiibacter aestuariivivens]QIE44913.1 glyoxalase/bleomycin resistance/extradiol dioxygenase family protein [Pseudohalocynthiibacter aestuariivivens]
MIIYPPTPELPVADVEVAQHYYHAHFGFDIAWYHAEGRIGAVSHGDCAIFMRQSDGPIHPATFWIYAADVDQTYAALTRRGADIIDPIADKPWGLRQFTARDLYGNLFHFHHDIDT